MINISSDPGIWVGALLIIMALSFLFKNTVLFRFFENTLVGAGIGHLVVLAIKNINDLGVAAFRNDMFVVVPILAGLLLFSRLHKQYYWLSRYGMAIMVGIGTGLTMRTMIVAQFLDQIRATIEPLTSVNNIIVIAGVLSTLAYFIFTIQKGPLQYVSKVGLWFMMVAFGVAVGTGLIGRVAYIVAAFRFLLFEWLGIAI